MSDTPSIDELAKSAIEAQRKYTNTQGADLPMDEVRELRNIWLRALDAFRSSISPEAWLSLSSRVEALEAFRERVANLYLRESNGAKDAAVLSVHDAAAVVHAARALSTVTVKGESAILEYPE